MWNGLGIFSPLSPSRHLADQKPNEGFKTINSYARKFMPMLEHAPEREERNPQRIFRFGSRRSGCGNTDGTPHKFSICSLPRGAFVKQRLWLMYIHGS
jgi:hypothetical protein